MLVKGKISILYFLKIIKWDLIGISAYATIVGSLDHISFFKTITVPLGVSALVGTLLSLLLAFRTAQSYERWWEARVVWGGIVNDSRTLVRQLIEFLPNTDNKSIYVKRIGRRQIIWCYALGERLRKLPSSEKVQQYSDEHNLRSENLPNLILTRHANDLAEISDLFSLNPNKQVQVDSTLQRLTDFMGRCERIKSTIFPRPYSLLIHFLIYVLMTILPFGLDDNNPFIEVFLVILIPSLFIAIERTAILMQDPFENKPNDTAMTSIAGTIERNILEMIDEPAPAVQEVPASYFVL